MPATDWWHLVMALGVVIAPLFLAWLLTARGGRKRHRGSGQDGHRRP